MANEVLTIAIGLTAVIAEWIAVMRRPRDWVCSRAGKPLRNTPARCRDRAGDFLCQGTSYASRQR
jgi:hypothetical protein